MTPHTEAELRGDLPLLNRTVAELLGWKPCQSCLNIGYKGQWRYPEDNGCTKSLPDFTGSLDACRTFEAGLTEEERSRYQDKLQRMAHHKRVYIWELEPQDHCVALCYLRNVITPTTPQ